MRNLKIARKNLGLTQKDVAFAIKIPTTTYASYEQKETAQPPVETLIKLADYFGCSIDYLLGHQLKDPVLSRGFTPAQKELLQSIQQLSDANCKRVQDFMDGILTAEEEKQALIRKFTKPGR